MALKGMAINASKSGRGVANESMLRTLHGLQRELHSLKEENRELKYQLVLLHSDPAGSLDVQQQAEQRKLEREVMHLREDLQRTREQFEASQIQRKQTEQENRFLKTKFKQLQDQAGQMKRMWEEQNAELTQLRQRQVQQSTFNQSHLDTLDRMGGASLRPGRRRPRHTSSSSSSGTQGKVSLSAPAVRGTAARKALPANLPPLSTSLHVARSKRHSREIVDFPKPPTS